MSHISKFMPKTARLAVQSEAEPNANRITLSRRAFLTASVAVGGGLMLDVFLNAPASAATGGADFSQPNFAAGKITLMIDGSDNVTLVVPGGEMGQGINSALAQIVAEGLPLDFSRIRTVPAPFGSQYANGGGSQVTGGSYGVRGYFGDMLQAGAIARTMLIAAAAAGKDVSTFQALPGYMNGNSWVPNRVYDSATGTTWTYGALASAAAGIKLTTLPAAGNSSAVIGQSVIRPDIRQKVNGSAVFGLDVMIPGMKFAAIRHAPVLGSTVATMGAAPGGTQAVGLGNAVAVIASNSWAAKKAVDSLAVTWSAISTADQALVDTSTQNSNLSSLLSSTSAVIAEAAPGDSAASIVSYINGQTKKLSLTYSYPMLAHTCMEVLNCTVEPKYATDGVTLTQVNVWCPTQAPDFVAMTVNALTGVPYSNITVTTTLMGGGFGRKIEQDYVAQAIQVARAAKGPVKLMWWREDDFARDFCRPAAMSKIQVALDSSNNISAWYNRVAAPSVLRAHNWVDPSKPNVDSIAIGSAVGNNDEPMPYAKAMARRVVDYAEQTTKFNLGFWRSVGQSISCFAVESAIDEIAKYIGQDPYAYRLSLTGGDAAMKAVLMDVVKLCQWDTTVLPADTRRGIALSPGFGSHCAVVAEVKKIVTTSSAGVVSTTYKVPRVFCSVDCGLAVNPDQVKAQIEGGILYGMNAARWGRMQFDKGISQVKNFGDYKLGRISDAPQIIVNIMGNSTTPGGIGEVGVPPIAPALANAYAALTGTRKRSLPLGF